MSRFQPLFDAIAKTGADELRLLVGERIHILRKGGRQDIGKEVLKAANIEPLVIEVLGKNGAAQVKQAHHTTRIDHGSVGYFVTFAANEHGIAVAIRAESKGPPLPILGPREPKVPDDPPSEVMLAASADSSRIEVAAPVRPEVTKRIEPARVEAPRVEAPRVEAPRVEAPRVEAPRAEAPRIEPPRVEAPRVEAPRGDSKSPLLDEILREMLSKKASDLHLSAEVSPVMRIHGEIIFTSRSALSSDQIFNMLEPVFSDKARVDFRENNDADFAYELPGEGRFRVNVFRDRKGVGAVLRQIPVNILTAEQLNLPKAVKDLCFLSKGLVVVTGPTGSGKSTTLAAMIDFINKNRNDHIITIEDPVEFVHPNIKCLVNQREIGMHTRSFKNALRAALREDPDIVLVGEMRDLETISIAMETAETGHLVFGTLHTTTAISTVDRIIDQFPTDQQAQVRVMLSESLKGVVAQVLCKKEGGGRVAALEILLVNHAVSAMIRDAKTFQIASIMQTQKGAGMVTMNDSLLQLVQSKQVSAMDAYIKSVDKAGLLNAFKNAGIPSPI
jgi:twitching motility protein PilT